MGGEKPGIQKKILGITVLLISLSLSCGLISNIGEQVGGARETAGAVATSVQEGRDLLSTGQALATQFVGSELVQTARAIATREGPSFLATVEAMATEHGPALQQTVEAFATQEGPGIQETLEAFATQQGPALAGTGEALITQGPDLVETAQAVATQVAGSIGDVPADIPLVEGERDDLLASGAVISYTTDLGFEAVLDFYEDQMPANGWTKSEDGSLTGSAAGILVFQKSARQATIAITAVPATGRTAVLITMQEGEE